MSPLNLQNLILLELCFIVVLITFWLIICKDKQNNESSLQAPTMGENQKKFVDV